jgi:hypothetical protein
MSVNLSDFIKNVKRACNYGDEDTTSDQPTQDILQSINRRRNYISVRAVWEFLREPFDVPITTSVQDITLDSSIGRLLAIGNNEGDYLRKVSIKEMLRWHTPEAGESDTTVVGYWSPLGRNSSTGAKKIRVLGTPNAAGTFKGYGLKVMTRLTTSDISAGNLFPWPDTLEELLHEFVCSDIERIQGKPEWRVDLQIAKKELEEAIRAEVSDPADDVTSPLPEYYRHRRVLLRAGYVV